MGLLVFILWPHFPQFSCIYTSLTKSYEHIYPHLFKYFKFFADVSIVFYPLLQLFYFYCIMLYSVCLLSEKKRSASRVLIHDCILFPNFHISKKFHVPAIFPMTSSKNWWRHREYICIIGTPLYWSYPVQSFMSLKVGRAVLPPPTQKWGSESPPGIGLNRKRKVSAR